ANAILPAKQWQRLDIQECQLDRTGTSKCISERRKSTRKHFSFKSETLTHGSFFKEPFFISRERRKCKEPRASLPKNNEKNTSHHWFGSCGRRSLFRARFYQTIHY